MTAPPYEWPTSTIGPSMLSSSALTWAASEDSPRSGFGAATHRIAVGHQLLDDRLNPLPSAKAPCTSTIVGFRVPLATSHG